MRLLLWLGAVFPAVVLLALLLAALPQMKPLPATAEDMTIAVEGRQFWWRMTYDDKGGQKVTSANELRLPAGRTVELLLTAGDVLHSFWVPGLAGKMDMIPGRTNRLVVRAEEPGVYRGQCTEFCGLGHAVMAFDVIVMEPAAFDRWLAALALPADPRAGEMAGARLFAQQGCGGCHRVAGTEADGTIGPNLTHFGARTSFAAGILPQDRETIARFIRNPQRYKPGATMPAFVGTTPDEALAIADYLKALN